MTIYDITLIDLFRALLKKWWVILLSGIVMGALAFGVTRVITKKYAVTALIESAKLMTSAPSKSALPKMLDFLDISPSIKNDAVSYLTHHYLNSVGGADSTAMLGSLLAPDGTNQINVIGVGPSIEEATLFLNALMKNLQSRYQAKIDDFKKDVLENLRITDEKISTLKARIAAIESALQEVSFNTNLIQEQTQNERELHSLLSTKVQLERAITDEKVHNFYYVEVLPASYSPVSPPTRKLMLVAILFGIFLSSLLVILGEEDRRAKLLATKMEGGKHLTPPVKLVTAAETSEKSA